MDITVTQATENNLLLIVTFDGVIQEGTHAIESSNPAVASLMSQDDSDAAREVMFELHPVMGQASISGRAANLSGLMIPWAFELNVMADPEPEAQNVTVSAGELIPKA